MKLWSVSRSGYKFLNLLFWIPFIFLGIVGYTTYMENGLDWYTYIKCDLDYCPNPLHPNNQFTEYGMRAEYTFTGIEIKPNCGDWCDLEYLPRGEYGKQVPYWISRASLFFWSLTILMFLTNHFLFNRGKRFDFIIPNSIADHTLKLIKKHGGKLEDD